MTNITKHKDWQKWQGALTEQCYYGSSDRQILEALAPLIFASGQEAEREHCKRIVKDKTYLTADCEHLSMVDPETGFAECSATDCLCYERIECAEQIYAAIKAELPVLAKAELAGLDVPHD